MFWLGMSVIYCSKGSNSMKRLPEFRLTLRPYLEVGKIDHNLLCKPFQGSGLLPGAVAL